VESQARRHLLLGAGVGAVAVAGVGYYSVFGPSSQWFGEFPYRARTQEKVVALTFDDGPNEPFTSQLVDVLGEQRVPATFFQVGRCVERHPGLSARMADAGHVIGNHSYSHRFLRFLTEPSLGSEISRTQEILSSETGLRPALFRPPWLGHPPQVLAEARRQGLRVVSGTFAHPLEVAQIPGWRIARHAVELARPGAMLIFHDGFDARGGYRGQTVEAVRLVVAELADRGFRFMTVADMLATAPYQGGTQSATVNQGIPRSSVS
jgi:peptidoglycan/xylan/chitin deacetylase (PgdA/CDA1 family)